MRESRESTIPDHLHTFMEGRGLLTRTRVKICGVTNREDACAAIDAGADALGFNLFPGSKRCISLEENCSWICELPQFVTRVAVLVNAPLDEVLRVGADPAIHLVQLHGDEDPDYCAELHRHRRPFIKAFRLRSGEALPAPELFGTPHILLDTWAPEQFGGTGTMMDFQIAREFVLNHPRLQVILAGGLTPENVRGAAENVRPFAVDVASGVEREPRRKDSAKMRAFCAALR